MLELLIKGGILMIPILLCSLAGLAIFFERLDRYRKITFSDETLALLCDLLEKNRTGEAAGMLTPLRKAPRQPLDAILLDALTSARADRQTMELLLSQGVAREIQHLGRHLGTMATLANIAPLLGLLGTVFGMIKAFAVVESLGGRVNAAVLAGGIWEAMITTAVGLTVAIPLIILHNYLENRLNTIQVNLEERVITFYKAWLNRERKGA
ncbi:MAG: MotA/TolQ/ExbB proton channel family protein [Thermodesulfobacteriota bacterium]